MANEVKIVGLEEAVKRLKKWQIVKTQAVKDRLKKQAFKVELAAKDVITSLVYNQPSDSEYRRTGRLRASISTNWAGSGLSEGKTGGQAEAGDGVKQPQGPSELVYVVGTNVHYGPYVEFGTSKMVERPYLFPAYFSLEGETVAAIAKILKEDITL